MIKGNQIARGVRISGIYNPANAPRKRDKTGEKAYFLYLIKHYGKFTKG